MPANDPIAPLTCADVLVRETSTSHAAQRRTRRLAAGLVALVGFVTLASSLLDPVADRMRLLEELLPITVPQTATALSALAGLSLLLVARGVRRGQRRAWAVCMVVLLASVVLHLLRGLDVAEAAVASTVALYLWRRRDRFAAASDTLTLRRGAPTLLAAAVATLLAGTLSIELRSWIANGRHRLPATSLLRALQVSAGRFVGLGVMPLPHRFAEFFDPAITAAAVGIGLGALALVLRPSVARWHGHEEARRHLARARAVVRLYGRGTLDYFALRDDKRFFFFADSVVAYAVYGTFCLVSPDPIGPPAERAGVWHAFRSFVDAQGWALGVLGAGEEWHQLYRSGGMRELYIGDEAVVPLQEFDLAGGRSKGLRQAVGRVARHGYTISFHDPGALDVELREKLRALSGESRRGAAERGFSMTLGRLFDPDDHGLLLAVVHAPPTETDGPNGRPVAFCHYVPAPGIGGYSLDVMRRECGSHPNGLIDFAIVETIRHLAAAGHAGLGLNFAVMRAVLEGEATRSPLHAAQAWATRTFAAGSQVESLCRFNAKYHPNWVPRFVWCDAPEHAVSAAVAIARAESLWEIPVIGRLLALAAGKRARSAA